MNLLRKSKTENTNTNNQEEKTMKQITAEMTLDVTMVLDVPDDEVESYTAYLEYPDNLKEMLDVDHVDIRKSKMFVMDKPEQ